MRYGYFRHADTPYAKPVGRRMGPKPVSECLKAENPVPKSDLCRHWAMSACLRRHFLCPHVGHGTLPQSLFTNAHLHHYRHQLIEILSSQGTNLIVTFRLDFLPRHVALGLERGGLDVLQEFSGTSVATVQPDGVGKGGIHQTGADLHPFKRHL